MTNVRWGVLGTAKIGREKVIPAMRQGRYCEITAIASRDFDKARETAASLGIAKAYGAYEDLLSDPDVDAVYVPLPNHLHVPWTLKAMEAGKHVLCEKPVAMSASEARSLAEAARRRPRLKVMEAFMYRHHPQWKRTKALVDDGRIGYLRTVHSFFSYYNVDPLNVRNQSDIGGGALMDVGCYCISLARYLFGGEPLHVAGVMDVDPSFGTDRLTSGVMEFETGTATFTCATQLVPHQRVHVFGTTGKIEIEIPFNAPSDRPTRIRVTTKGETEEMTFPVCDQYTLQGDAFSRAVLQGEPVPVPLEDAVQNMTVVEKLRQRIEGDDGMGE